MKSMKPVVLRHAEPLAEGYKLWPVSDQWSELLPTRIPLRFALFRYLGFYVTETKRGKSTVFKSRKLAAVRVTIRNDAKVVFRERVQKAFANGVYYVQDISLASVGMHTVTIEAEGPLAAQIEPLVLHTQVYEFMTLDECPDLQTGVYQPLREFVLDLLDRGRQDELRDDEFREKYIREKKLPLRNMDARWWLRAFVEHTLDREERQKLLQIAAVENSCRTTHKRKQDHPSRTADKKEHENLFERRRREWKRVRAGDLRMFTNESLHAGKTVTVYSAKEMYHQLSLYAQR